MCEGLDCIFLVDSGKDSVSHRGIGNQKRENPLEQRERGPFWQIWRKELVQLSSILMAAMAMWLPVQRLQDNEKLIVHYSV